VAGCATSTGSAGHAGAQANLKLTFRLDHPVGADQLPQAQRLEMRYRPASMGAAGSIDFLS